jgi:CTP synthase (UTP-ammonia lyase)
MTGAVNAIQYARENKIPFIGTCGGFQHAVLEYARDVLKIKEVAEEDFDLYSPNAFISQLSCSLVGQTRHILLDRNSFVYDIYGKPETEEKYNCSFGLNKDFQNKLDQAGFKVVGTDEQGEARIMILDNHQFFLATLFQPQLTSTPDNPHPLVLAYLSYVRDLDRM